MAKFIVRIGYSELEGGQFNLLRFGPFETEELAHAWIEGLWDKLSGGKHGSLEEADKENFGFEDFVQDLFVLVEKIQNPLGYEEVITIIKDPYGVKKMT